MIVNMAMLRGMLATAASRAGDCEIDIGERVPSPNAACEQTKWELHLARVLGCWIGGGGDCEVIQKCANGSHAQYMSEVQSECNGGT